MRARGIGVLRFAMPVKAMAHRFAFLLLVAAGAALLVIGKADIALVERARTSVMDALAPVLTVFRQPLDAARTLVDEARAIVHLRSENVRLREENARLLRWQDVARRLEQDNARFRQLLHATSDPAATFVSARVVGDTGGAFVRTMLLNAGARDGVEKGQAVIGDAGLVGRVVEVGSRSSRILLLTDLNSRVPVAFEQSRYRGILSGDNTDQPRIEFLPASAQVSAGDRVVTSGHGGLFPAGLAIGVVSSVSDRAVRVKPFTDWDRLEMVSVIRYEMPRPPAAPERAAPRYGGPR